MGALITLHTPVSEVWFVGDRNHPLNLPSITLFRHQAPTHQALEVTGFFLEITVFGGVA